ncbi:MAG: efflux RND transporter permease subunit [Candidatus Stahlbacteria bacterium]|nr:efflux RND transporter permease subunit [Candidatus Stahlbacteria bacterium]
MNLIKFSVNRRVTITMMTLILVLLGVISFSKLGLDLLPDIEYPVISVLIPYSGVAPQEIETQLTKPVEEAVAMVKGVKSVNSISEEGVSVVTVELEWGTNLDFAAQDIRDKIGLIESYLPEEAGSPLVLKFDMSMMPVVFYGATGDCDLEELRETLKDKLKNKLERIDGVASCGLMGGLEREINISVDRNCLASHNIGLTQIISALRASNMNVSSGYLTRGYKEYSIRALGEYGSLDEIGNTVVSFKDGIPIKLKDIAKINDTYKDVRGYGRTQGKESIVFMITKQSGANTVIISNKIKKEMNKIKSTIPHNIKFHLIFDQGEMITKIAKRTGQSALQGSILAILLILLFLRSWRPTLTIGIAIPFSIIVTFIAMYFAGYTLNLMTLVGLALGVGMLVDNSIVVIESIYRKIEDGEDRKNSAIHGTNEVGMAITASTLTTIAVFIPLIFSGGIAGKLSRALALTISLSLLASLFIAFTIVPMLASMLFRKQKEVVTEGWFDRLKNKYEMLLKYTLTHKKKTIITVGITFIVTLLLIPFIGREFMPSSDIPFIQVTLTMPVGTSLEETNRITSQLEAIVKSIPEVENVCAFIGLSEATQHDVAYGSMSAGVNQAQVMGKLVEKSKRRRTSNDIMVELRKKFPNIEGAKIDFADMSGSMFGSSGTPVNIKIFGDDFTTLEKISSQIANQIKDVKGLKEINTSIKEGKPELQIKINKEKSALFGLTIYQIGQEVKTAIYGTVAGRFRGGGEDIDINIDFTEENIQSIKDIENIPITTPMGFTILLKQAADIILTEGPVKIEREEQMRKASVTANIEKRDIGGVMKDISKKIEPVIKSLPSGYSTEFGGEYEQMRETFIALGIAFIFALILVYMIMAALFESFVHPFVIMFTVPLAIIGVLWGLFLAHKTISMPALMGVIILAGIVVNNAVVFIDYTNQLRAKNMNIYEALIEAGKRRLRPILITALTTILGMLPMAFGHSEGTEMRSPMAVVVISGLFISTVLTLIIIPVLYTIFEGFKIGIRTKGIKKSRGPIF